MMLCDFDDVLYEERGYPGAMTDTTFEPVRKVVTAIPGPKSQELMARYEKAVPKGITPGYASVAEFAEGAIIRDVDGNQLIDLGSGIGVTTLGHRHPKVVEAVKAQADQFLHMAAGITPYELYITVAEKLAANAPGEFAKKAFFMNSGAEAVENAVKIARAYTGKANVAVLDHSFHGRTNLTMAMNHKSVYATKMGPLAGSVHHAPNSYPYRDGLSGEEAAARTIEFLEKRIGAVDLAAVIAEPIQGEGGFIVAADGYYNKLIEWCHANDVLFVADEVQSGIARSGKFFASEYYGIEPDLITFAKGIADGMVLSGVLGRAEVMDAPLPGRLGGTYGGNPTALAAANAVIDAIHEENLCEEALRIEKGLRAFFEEQKTKTDVIGDIRGHGAMFAVEFVEAGTAETTKKPNTAAVKTIVDHAFANGVILLTCGSYGNVIRFLPSVTLTDEQLQDALSVIAEGIAKL